MDASPLASHLRAEEVAGPAPRGTTPPCAAKTSPGARSWMKPAPGQAVVEYAIVAAVAVVFSLVSIQYGLIVAQKYGANYVARETARWLAVRIDKTDAEVTTQAQTVRTDLPGLAGSGMGTVTVSPSCAALTASKCSGRSSGDAITVTVNFNPTAVMFLPTSFGFGKWSVQFPTGADSARTTVMLE